MPISKTERNRLKSHTFSEDKKEEFNATHFVMPNIDIAKTLKLSFKKLGSKTSVLFLNIFSSLIFTIYIYLMLEFSSFMNLLWYTIAFFILEILVVAPITAITKAKLSDMKSGSLVSPMLISLNYLEPLIPVAYIGLIILILQSLTLINLFSAVVFGVLSIIILIIAIILQISNLNSSISIQILYDKKLGRNVALSRSWMLMSGQSLRLLAINILSSLPVIIAIIFDVILIKTSFIGYFV